MSLLIWLIMTIIERLKPKELMDIYGEKKGLAN